MQQIDCFYFYFDVVGVVESYLGKKPVFDDLLSWQRQVRAISTGGRINCKTFADNVLVRFEVDGEYPIDYDVLQFAGKTMKAARRFGFNRFFGAITKGVHEFDIGDRTLTSYGSPTDLSHQHLDFFGDPYLRAVLAEKWSGYLAKGKIHPGEDAVWVSEEVVLGGLPLEDAYRGQTLEFKDLNIEFDLHDQKFKSIKEWPFPESKFRLIG